MSGPKNILLIKLGALGDFVMSLGSMHEVRKAYPNVRLTLLTGQAYMGLAESSHWFDEILPDDRINWNFSAWYRVIKRGFLDHGFDLVIDMQNANRTRFRYFQLMRWLSAKEQTWLNGIGNGWESRRIVPRPGPFPAHIITEPVEPPFQFEETDLSFCKGPGKNFGLLPKTYALLIPGCSAANAYKRWPASDYAALATLICDAGIGVVVLGTTAEKETIEQIVSAEPRVIHFMGKASIIDIPELARLAWVVVGNDTGPMHMASYCRTHVIALFCARTAFAQRHAPNVANLCGEAIADIQVDTVWQAVKPLLGRI